MVRRIEKGEAHGILTWHPNRLSRNSVDTGHLIYLMDKAKLLEVRTPGQTFKNTPSDKFLLSLLCSQAKLENDNKGIDVKRGLRTKAEMGWYPGVAPMGYLNDKTKNRGERDLMKDPERFNLVHRMWKQMLTGACTPPQILKIANEEWGFRTRLTKKMGGTPLGLSSLYHVSHNPFYYGWFEYPVGSGQWHKGRHEPMVTKEEYDRVQALVGRNWNPRPSVHRVVFPFTGLIRCGECGGTVTAEEKHQLICSVCRFKFAYRSKDQCPRCQTLIAKMSNPLFLHYTYYHCTKNTNIRCSQGSIRGDDLERQIKGQLARSRISPRFRDWALKYLQELHCEELASLNGIKQSRQKAYGECLLQIENLVKLKTSPQNADGSLLSDEEYSSRRLALLQEKARLEQSPETIRQEAEQDLRDLKKCSISHVRRLSRLSPEASRLKRRFSPKSDRT